MTVLLRSFVVWLMLLALPYQGYAAARMLLCVAPATAQATAMHAAMTMPAGPHDHAAMMAAQAHAEHQHDGNGTSGHANMKCSGSACCAATAPVLALLIPTQVLPSAAAVPFHSEFLPAVDLAHPERPPQGRYA
jgi:hypothetical protein